MRGLKVTLTEGRQQLERVVDQLEAVRLQLLGILSGLPEPPEEAAGLEDVGEEPDAATELRTTISCVLDDAIRPALQDLREVLASMEEKTEKAPGH